MWGFVGDIMGIAVTISILLFNKYLPYNMPKKRSFLSRLLRGEIDAPFNSNAWEGVSKDIQERKIPPTYLLSGFLLLLLSGIYSPILPPIVAVLLAISILLFTKKQGPRKSIDPFAWFIGGVTLPIFTAMLTHSPIFTALALFFYVVVLIYLVSINRNER